MIVLVFLGVAMLLYCLWLPTVKRGLKRLTCTRAFDRTIVYQGEEGKLVEVVRNDSPYAIPWLRMESKISPHIRLGSQKNLHVSQEQYYCSLFTLMPYQQIQRTHKVTYTHRGAFNLGNASLTAGDFLGITSIQRSQSLDSPVIVYPRLLDQDNLPELISRMLGDLSRQRQLLRDPFLVKGIRAYQPGDHIRDIHWPATARSTDLQVRVHDYTAKTKLLVVLNGQYLDLQFSDRLPDHKLDMMEYAISLAATVCSQAARDGFPVGFASNMPLDDSPNSTLLLPESGDTREEEILAAMAHLDTIARSKFPVFLESLTVHTGLDILVLSSYDSEAIRNSIRMLQNSGNQVTFYRFEGGVS